jgi:SAM-dependent methyltransferase
MNYRFRAKAKKDGSVVEGYYAVHHIAQLDNRNVVTGYKETHNIFNDDPGNRDKGCYWKEIEQSSLEMINERIEKPILDACCGSRMFWFDKDNPNVVFMDKRDEVCTLSDGQTVIVHPNIVGDFTAMPFPDKSFKLVVFDPPHLVWAGKASNLYKRYGKLDNWQEELRKGVDECFRVLDDYGVLIFKWAETQLKIKTIINTIGRQPLFGHKRLGGGKTVWMAFMKFPEDYHGKN